MSVHTQSNWPIPKGLGFSERVHKVKQYLQRGEFSLAEASLTRLNPVSKSQMRTHAHYLGRVYLYRGDFTEALSLFLQAERRFGPNINLTVDIANCRYRLGHNHAWEQRVVLLEKTLRGEHLLCEESSLYAQLSLAKFKEELGEISEALKIYLRLRDQHRDKTSLPYFSLLAQLLRVLSLGQDQPLLAETYRELIHVKELHPQLYLDIEIQHALMLAEVRQIGPNAALARMESQFQRLDIDQSDRRLILFDLLDEFLLRRLDITPLLERAQKHSLSHLDPYEATLLRLADNEVLSSQDWIQLPRQVSTGCYLRLLSLSLNSECNPELTHRWHLLMGALSPASAQAWSGRLAQSQSQNRFIFNSHTGELRLPSHKSVSFKRRKALSHLLRILSRSNRIPVETAIQELWGTGYSPSHFERLRISAHRLNQ